VQPVDLSVQVLHEVVGRHPGKYEPEGRTHQDDDEPGSGLHVAIVSRSGEK
jgi:hypothetical protein